jgi:uncharacterized membrane protein required for colicin V production
MELAALIAIFSANSIGYQRIDDRMNFRLDQLPFNSFDMILVGILVAGLLVGRKHGMSQELISVLKWVTVLVVCAVLYEPMGQLFKSFTKLFGLLTCYLVAYAVLAGVIVGLFALLKRALGGKLIGSDVFGKSEYYLGMGSGLVRFACILLCALALLNARYYKPTEVRAMEKFQDDVYGSNFFPTLHTVQYVVFERSITGSWIKQNLSFLLIKPTSPENTALHQKDAEFP